jgi:hypothetical protein
MDMNAANMDNRDILLDITKSVGIIMASQDMVKEDVASLKTDIGSMKTNCSFHSNKIVQLESNVNSHLTSHDNLRKFFFWPVSVAVTIGGAAILLKVIFHLF